MASRWATSWGTSWGASWDRADAPEPTVILTGGDDAPRRKRRRKERTFHDFARELEATIHGLLHPAPVDDRQETPPPSLSPDAAERALNELVVLAHGQHARLQQVAALRTDLHKILAVRDRMLEQDEEDALLWMF